MASTSATLCHSHGAAAKNVPFAFAEDEQVPSPPPPTPCNQSLSTGETDAFLSHLLARLSMPAPTLAPVLPLRRRKNTVTTTPVISLHEPDRQLFLSAATELGFFHVTDHDLPLNLQETCIENYRSDIVFSGTMFEPDVADEFARDLERVGSKVLEFLFEERQIGTETTRRLMCVFSRGMDDNSLMEKAGKEQLRNCVLQLTYEGRGKKVPSAVVDDSGKRVPVEACKDAVLVTLGEVAQVWSNGKFKKVRILPQPSPPSLHQREEPRNILVTLLITVPEYNSTGTAPLVPTVQDTEISSGELH